MKKKKNSRMHAFRRVQQWESKFKCSRKYNKIKEKKNIKM